MDQSKTSTRENSSGFESLKKSSELNRTISEPTTLLGQRLLGGPYLQGVVSPAARSYLTKQLEGIRESNDMLRPDKDDLVDSRPVMQRHISIQCIPSYIEKNPRQLSHHSFAGSVRSLPLTPSDSDDEDENSLAAPRGERNRVRELEDIANWVPAEPVQVTRQAPAQTFSHLPHWSTLERPFLPIKQGPPPSAFFREQGLIGTGEETDNPTSEGSVELATESESSCDSPMIPAFPPGAESGTTERLTAYPQENIIRKDLEERLLRLLDINHFEQFLSDSEARKIFRNWLIKTSDEFNFGTSMPVLPANVIKLDQWTDESVAVDLVAKLRAHSEALMDVYYRQSGTVLTPTRPKAVARGSFIDALQLASSKTAFGPSRRWLLESLYEQDFKNFITSKLVDMCKMKLGSGIADKDYSGLGDSFVLTNPRFKDNPVVIVSPSFSAVTGYEASTIIGRNCRFLQGPGTSPKSIERLRNSLRAGEPCVELLLNYRSDGTPFQCLLSILPLFDQTGALTYFIGGQVNIAGELDAYGDIAAFTHSSTESLPSKAPNSDGLSPSPTMKRHLNRQVLRGATASGYERMTSKSDLNKVFQPHSRDPSSSEQPATTKRSALEWLTSKVKREKEVLTLDFNGSAARFASPTEKLEKNIHTFQTSYSRLLLFKKNSREIVFVTEGALKFLGLPTETHSDTYSSPLIHTDFLELVEASKVNRKTKNLKSSLKNVIENNTAASFQCNLSWKYIPYTDDKGTLNKSKKVTVTRNCFIHLSPLIDCSSNCTSYIAVLG